MIGFRIFRVASGIIIHALVLVCIWKVEKTVEAFSKNHADDGVSTSLGLSSSSDSSLLPFCLKKKGEAKLGYNFVSQHVW